MFTMLRGCNTESVYNLIERPDDIPAPGPPIYRSRYSCKVREDAFCNKTGCYRTMGVPRVDLCPPQCYLKKNTRAAISIQPPAVPMVQMTCEGTQTKDATIQPENSGVDECCEAAEDNFQPQDCSDKQVQMTTCNEPQKCRLMRFCTCLGQVPKPPVPSACTGFGIVPAGNTNFIHRNVVKAIRQIPRKPALRYVDDRAGTTRNWCSSGLPRKYVCNENFGKVPGYISCIKDELCQKDQMAAYAMREKEREMQSKCRHLDPTEREAISCGLKKNWEEVFAEYQAMPLNIDTPGKVIRKSELEKQLQDLETDIQMIERHDHVFVADTLKSFYLA